MNKNFHDDIAADWIRIIESPGARVREKDIYPLLREWSLRIQARKTLEVGCGQGVCSDHVVTERYTGIDPSPLIINRATELYGSDTRMFQTGQAEALPFTNASFDSVYFVNVWHLLADVEIVAAEVARVLSPGGRFLIIGPNPEAYTRWTANYKTLLREGKRIEGTREGSGKTLTDVLFLHSRDDILSALEKSGLSVSKESKFRDDFYLLIEGYN